MTLYIVLRDRVVVDEDVVSYSVVQFKKGGDREGILKAIRTKSILKIDQPMLNTESSSKLAYKHPIWVYWKNQADN